MVKISLDSERVPREALSHLAWNDPVVFSLIMCFAVFTAASAWPCDWG